MREVAEDYQSIGVGFGDEATEPLAALVCTAIEFDAALIAEPDLDTGVHVGDEQQAPVAEIGHGRRFADHRLDGGRRARCHQIGFSVPSPGS